MSLETLEYYASRIEGLELVVMCMEKHFEVLNRNVERLDQRARVIEQRLITLQKLIHSKEVRACENY